MIKVYVKLRLSSLGISFSKVVKLFQIPTKMDLLKICNESFIVTEVEHDIDAYIEEEHENGSFCDSIVAELNPELGEMPDTLIQDLVEGLRKKEWIEIPKKVSTAL